MVLVTEAMSYTDGFSLKEKNIAPAKKLNIVLFIANDHGYKNAGCCGAKVVRTPNLDAFAKEACDLRAQLLIRLTVFLPEQ